MKQVCALILSLVLLFGLAACGDSGKSDDPNMGKWNAVSASIAGIEMDISELFEGAVTLELRPGGKLTLDVDGDKASGKWEYTGNGMKVTASKVDMTATLDEGFLTLKNLFDMGVDIAFKKEGGLLGAIAGAAKPAAAGDAGYYKLSWGSEDGETITGDDLRALGLDYYVLLHEDGTALFQTDNTVSGTWKNGILSLSADGMTEELPYKLEGDELTIEADGLTMVFARSSETPPAQAPQSQKAQVPTRGASSADPSQTALQQWWSGDWYGFIYLPTADGAWETLEDGFWDCFGTIEVDAAGNGSIYLWDDGGELGDVTLQITQQGVSEAGVAMSEEGSFNLMEIGHADWIIDPGTNAQSYDHMIIIDGTFEDPDGDEYGGFMYEIWLRPWGMLWDDASPEDQPPGYYDWYLDRRSGPMPTMSEFLSGIDSLPASGGSSSGGSSSGGGSALTTEDFDSFTVGYPAGTLLEDDWLNGRVIKDEAGVFEVQFSEQYSQDQVASVREGMAAYLTDPEAKGATEFSRPIGGVSDAYCVKYDSVIWNEAMISIAYPGPIDGCYGLQVCVKAKDTKNKIDDVLALAQVQAILDSIALK